MSRVIDVTEMLKKIVPLLQKLQEAHLTAKETKRAFTTIVEEDTDGYFFFVFMAMLSTKGETAEELYGLCQGIREFCPEISWDLEPRYLTDPSGTGGAQLTTLNVSTAASFVIAGGDITVAKQAFPSLTGPTGSADVFRSFGVNVFGMGPQRIKKYLRKTGIVGYNTLMSVAEEVGNLKQHIRTQAEEGLLFRTPLNLIGQAYTPLPLERRVYGMFSDEYLHTVAEVFQKLGYTHTLVFYGEDGLSEISNLGKTLVVETRGQTREEYTILPEDLGIEQARYADIRVTDANQSLKDFLRVLYGEEMGAKRDLVLINAAASLYVLGKADALRDGVELAEKILDQGRASEKLESLVEACGNWDKLEDWKKKAGVSE